jgi:alpha 1,2-mannosyltransferase
MPGLILYSLSRLQATLLVIISVLAFFLLAPLGGQSKTAIQNMHSLSTFQHIGPALQSTEQRRHDPLQWLAKNSGDKHAISRGFPSQILELGDHGRPRAALISLVRNSELQGIIQSMRQMEYRWNTKYQVILTLRCVKPAKPLVVSLDFFQR